MNTTAGEWLVDTAAGQCTIGEIKLVTFEEATNRHGCENVLIKVSQAIIFTRASGVGGKATLSCVHVAPIVICNRVFFVGIIVCYDGGLSLLLVLLVKASMADIHIKKNYVIWQSPSRGCNVQSMMRLHSGHKVVACHTFGDCVVDLRSDMRQGFSLNICDFRIANQTVIIFVQTSASHRVTFAIANDMVERFQCSSNTRHEALTSKSQMEIIVVRGSILRTMASWIFVRIAR